VVRDAGRSQEVRRWAAERLLNSGIVNPNELSAEEQALLKTVSEKKD